MSRGQESLFDRGVPFFILLISVNIALVVLFKLLFIAI